MPRRKTLSKIRVKIPINSYRAGIKSCPDCKSFHKQKKKRRCKN